MEEICLKIADHPGELSEEARYFIGGLLAHSKEMALITNPLVNSYKRLVPGYDAPTELTWTENNQNSLVRIPGDKRRGNKSGTEKSGCIFQSVSGVCSMSCSRTGWNPKQNFSYKIVQYAQHRIQETEHLPETLKDAIEFFENSTWIQGILGEEFCRTYLAQKKDEWLRYIRQVTDWEVEEYLYRL